MRVWCTALQTFHCYYGLDLLTYRYVDFYLDMWASTRKRALWQLFQKKTFLAVFARSMRDVSIGQSACTYSFPFLRY